MKKRWKNNFSPCLLEVGNIVTGLTFSVLYALVFLIIYAPFSNTAWFGVAKSESFLLTTTFVVASVLYLIISRTVMFYVTKKSFKMNYIKYALWLFGEILLIGVFHAFLSMVYIKLPNYTPLFIIAKSIFITFLALGVPYVVSALWVTLKDMHNTLQVTDTKNIASDGEAIAQNIDIINIADNKGVLKFSVKLDNLYYIKAEDNYTIVYYSKNGMLNRYMIRCKIQTIEDTFRGTPLMRCHRTYIVNTNKIKVLRHESDGFYMDFDFEGIDPIPVSKTYTKSVVDYFSGRK
ncbi:MAG: LytTR family transcriptional regulator DNA-binding domain-containing protein [Bacteroidales bacterium]|nr:LytTR family transcriptional regulator DNA-binding domain-containing protein [Bacteroidales bacterium]